MFMEQLMCVTDFTCKGKQSIRKIGTCVAASMIILSIVKLNSIHIFVVIPKRAEKKNYEQNVNIEISK